MSRSPQPNEKEPATFGARFLAEYRRLGGGFGELDYRTIQELKRCDREAFVAVVRRSRSTLWNYSLLQLAKSLEPEELALILRDRQELAARAATAHLGIAGIFWPLSF
jgi:hypothetical protein